MRSWPYDLVRLLALAAIASTAAQAGEVPRSARSIALGMAPDFLDDPSLVFQHPQRAGGMQSEAFFFNENLDSAFDEIAMGVVGGTGSHGFFVLAQRNPALFSMGSTMQVGWGVSGESLRAGLALRSGFLDSDRETEGAPGTPQEINAREWQLEGSAGVGLELERFALDVAVDLLHHDNQSSSSRRDPFFEAAFETREGRSWGVTGRTKLPLTQSSDLVAHAGWTAPTREFEARSTSENDTTLLRAVQELSLWSAGLALVTSTRHVDWISVSANWSHTEVPIAGGSNVIHTRTNVQERVAFVVSLSENVWRELSVQAGGGIRYDNTSAVSVRITPDAQIVDELGTESFDHVFSWGASYAWRSFRIHGAVDTTVDLNELFLALDLRASL